MRALLTVSLARGARDFVRTTRAVSPFVDTSPCYIGICKWLETEDNPPQVVARLAENRCPVQLTEFSFR